MIEIGCGKGEFLTLLCETTGARGVGFDPEAVPPDRRGVRDSIIARMERHHGRAAVHSAPDAGTEVELVMELGAET